MQRQIKIVTERNKERQIQGRGKTNTGADKTDRHIEIYTERDRDREIQG